MISSSSSRLVHRLRLVQIGRDDIGLGDSLQESLMVGAEHEYAHRLPKQHGVREARAPARDMFRRPQQGETAGAAQMAPAGYRQRDRT